MTREETSELIKIMQHFVDGGAVDASRIDTLIPEALGESIDPTWNFAKYIYRIKATQDQFTDWSVLPPKYKWIARDNNGVAYAGTEPPRLTSSFWRWGDTICPIRVDMLTVFKRGTCDWQDSLIERPEGV